MTATPYEHFRLFRRLPPFMCWTAVGVLSWLLGESMLRAFGDRRFPVTQAMAAIGMAFLPISFISFARRFRITMDAAAEAFWAPSDSSESWIERRGRSIFTLETWESRTTTIAIAAAAVATVIHLGPPFENRYVNVLAVVGFALLALVCGHAGHICISLLVTLDELASREVRIPFFFIPHPAIAALQSFYSYVGVSIAIAYAILTIGVWKGPWGFATELLVWLSVLAALPLGLFFWSQLQIHRIIKSAKYKHARLVSTRIQEALAAVLRNDGADAEELTKLMEAQAKVFAIREWPVNLAGGVTFTIAAATAAVQILVAINELTR